MNVKPILAAVCLLAATASAASPQGVRTPIVFGTPVTSPAPADANGAAPFSPTQVQKAYGIDSLVAAGNAGAGQTIAIIDAYNYPNALSALNTFSSTYHLPLFNQGGSSPAFTVLNESGGTALPGTDPSAGGDNWEGEEALDIEWAHVAAPQANIILYEATNDDTLGSTHLETSVVTAKSNSAVSVISMSWGSSEFSTERISTSDGDPVYKTPSTRLANKQGVTFVAATGDNGVPSGYPAFSPNVVAVGGSTLHLKTDNSYSSETAWSWNASQQWGAGGGTSSYETKPSYQSSYGSLHGGILATANRRATPNVALVSDPVTGVYVYDSYNGGWQPGVGGTSLATPLFAGLIADANAIRSATGNGTLDGLTQTLPALYSFSGDFHDITSGNVDPFGSPSFSAGPGFDLATGLGSPIANQLVLDLANYGVVIAPYHWVAAASGNWSTPANWSTGVPNGIGASATINVPTASPLTVTLNVPVTLGSLLLGNSASAAAGYTLSGSVGNTLTFSNSGSGATISVADGLHTINASVVLNDNLVVAASGTRSWVLSFAAAGSIADNGGHHSLTMSGAGGTLVLMGTNSYSGGTIVNGGTLIAASAFALPAGSRVTVSGSGTLNLGSGTLLTNDSNSGMTGGSLLTAFHDVGYSGTGTFTQSGGTSMLSDSLYVGCDPGDMGSYNLSGSGLFTALNEFVGLAASGSFSQSGGTNTAGSLVLAQGADSMGTYNLNGGLLSLGALIKAPELQPSISAAERSSPRRVFPAACPLASPRPETTLFLTPTATRWHFPARFLVPALSSSPAAAA